MRMSVEDHQLIDFLTQDLAIPSKSLEVGRRRCQNPCIFRLLSGISHFLIKFSF